MRWAGRCWRLSRAVPELEEWEVPPPDRGAPPADAADSWDWPHSSYSPLLSSSRLHPRPSDRQAVAGRGAHEGVDYAAASAASRLSPSSPRRRGQGRSMSAEREEKAALEPEAGAMPEKRAGAQAAGGSSVSTGGGPAALISSRLLVKGGWAGLQSESEVASERCPDSPPGVGKTLTVLVGAGQSPALGSPSFFE